MTTRQVIGYSVGWLGILWTLATLVLEAVLHVRGMAHLPTHLLYLSIAVGVGLGWWGFFWSDGKRAKDGGTFMLDANERIHAHRRATDIPEPESPDADVRSSVTSATGDVSPAPADGPRSSDR